MTLDTYSACSYRCLYCFSFFQKILGPSRAGYLRGDVRPVSVPGVKRLFTGADLSAESSMFAPYIRAGRAFQWGGLADQFDEYERKYGVTLELLKFFRERKQHISFSTKATWWTLDSRYTDLFNGADFWHVKVSLITANEEYAKRVEVMVPTVRERIDAIRRLSGMGLHGVTLRFRPFIIGISSPQHRQLIAMAADAGANSVSTEFLCMETRAKIARSRYEAMGRLAGYDLLGFYRRNSSGAGYLRLNRDVKRKYMDDMQDECAKRGLRFYVSDAHFKERSANGCCCGAGESFPYSRGQFLEGLLIAKKNGQVRFSDIDPDLQVFGDGNCKYAMHAIPERRAQFDSFTLRQWMRWTWNSPNELSSPYRYFGGVLVPCGRDENDDVIYRYEKGST